MPGAAVRCAAKYSGKSWRCRSLTARATAPGRVSMPARRSLRYVVKLVFDCSPSVIMSMPCSACCCTAAATAFVRRCCNAGASYGWPASLARSMSRRSDGMGRLPAWVVKMRSVLRCISWSSFSMPGSALR